MVEANKQPQDEQHRNPVSEISDILDSTFDNKKSNYKEEFRHSRISREVSIDLIELGTRHDALK
jgi:hypothetical protein